MNHEEFVKIQPELTAKLAQICEAKLIEMGDDVKEISWFNSNYYNKPSMVCPKCGMEFGEVSMYSCSTQGCPTQPQVTM